MPIILNPEEGSSGGGEPVKPETPTRNGCELFGLESLLVAQQGTKPELEYIFRDDDGNPVDLSHWAALAETDEDAGAGSRIKEVISPVDCQLNPLLEITGEIHTATTGAVRFQMPQLQTPGIYEFGIAIFDSDGVPVLTRMLTLLIERSLFGTEKHLAGYGPPTLDEIRQAIRDSDPLQNRLIAELEFSSKEIVQAMTRPIRSFNEAPPPLDYNFDSRSFPFRENWLRAIVGQLMTMAAHSYRRNQLIYSAGGKTIDDQNKFTQYDAIGSQLLADYEMFVRTKKIEINTANFSGVTSSMYATVARGF